MRDNAFIAVLNQGSVEVSRFYEDISPDEGPHWVEYFELAILDAVGRIADRYSSEPGLSGHDAQKIVAAALGELYRLARSSAMSAASLVEELIGELK